MADSPSICDLKWKVGGVMSRWRVAVVLILFLLPFAALAGVGGYFLWQQGWALIAWAGMAACVSLSLLLGWYWQRKQGLLKPVFTAVPLQWTERDQQAWKLVEARAKEAGKVDPDKLVDFNF